MKIVLTQGFPQIFGQNQILSQSLKNETNRLLVFQRVALNGQLNSDLEKISNWAHQWKMPFNVDPKKQVQEAIF